jgi:predicted unusual protein kinase regulating ubiquinone biosynthesis (AarF/ABC1/UbiB family)
MTKRKTSAKKAPADAAAIKKQIETLAHHIFELDAPILQARNLVVAIRMMATSDDIETEAGAAIEAVTEILSEIIGNVHDARDDIWQMARNTAHDVVVAS